MRWEQPGRSDPAGLSFVRRLSLLQEHAVEHGEDNLLLGLGEAADALELALELWRRPALAGGLAHGGAGDAQEHVGGHVEERREPGHQRDGEPEAADLVVDEGLLGDAQVIGDGLLGEAGLLAQLREAAAELLPELPVGRRHGMLPVELPRGPVIHGRAMHDNGGVGGRS